ncbi:MAG: rhodanese-related sulfurtransferase [Armatimonadetes bacterium]|nr:rhodanese-related sulfurtransferase [Armatimonadota bacterium]
MWQVVTFYRFVDLPDYADWRPRLAELAARHGLCGTILLASEGINATVSAQGEALNQFLEELESHAPFAQLEKKFSQCEEKPFQRMKVRLKKEIVRMKAPEARPNEGVGKYIEPKDWNAVISDPNTLVIDVRNDYEIEMGTFCGAVDPKTKEFWQFPAFAEQIKEKNRPIAMFCTGGIRCEKATAYMLKHGFTNVMHLHGGILKYLEEVDEGESMWEGSCFVFDEREALEHQVRPIKKSKSAKI